MEIIKIIRYVWGHSSLSIKNIAVIKRHLNNYVNLMVFTLSRENDIQRAGWWYLISSYIDLRDGGEKWRWSAFKTMYLRVSVCVFVVRILKGKRPQMGFMRNPLPRFESKLWRSDKVVPFGPAHHGLESDRKQALYKAVIRLRISKPLLPGNNWNLVHCPCCFPDLYQIFSLVFPTLEN